MSKIDDIMRLYKVEESYIKIHKSNNLVDEMQKEVEKYTKLLELAKNDQLNVIKHNINVWDFLYKIPSAKDYLHKKMDKRTEEYKSDKRFFEQLQDQLRELFGSSIVITEIIGEGLPSYVEDICFTYNGSTYQFTVPVPENLTVKNLENADLGKFTIGKFRENANIVDILKSSYHIEDIQKAFKDQICLS